MTIVSKQSSYNILKLKSKLPLSTQKAIIYNQYDLEVASYGWVGNFIAVSDSNYKILAKSLLPIREQIDNSSMSTIFLHINGTNFTFPSMIIHQGPSDFTNVEERLIQRGRFPIFALFKCINISF